MTQRSLPIWEAKHLHTYSEIEEFRGREYAQSGPKLVGLLSWNLERYVETSGAEYLSEANQTVITLEALCPEWRDFSTEIFMACFPTFQKDHGLTPEHLWESFTTLLERLASQKAA
jgi:hypothetical protein